MHVDGYRIRQDIGILSISHLRNLQKYYSIAESLSDHRHLFPLSMLLGGLPIHMEDMTCSVDQSREHSLPQWPYALLMSEQISSSLNFPEILRTLKKLMLVKHKI